MVRNMMILAAAFAAVAGATQAGERCSEPYAPTIKLSASATKQDVISLRGDAQAFMAASDVYQKCLASSGASQGLVHANQALKEKVGLDFNNALHAYQAAHPGAEIASR